MKDIRSQITIDIIDITNKKDIQNTLKKIYLKDGQDVVYLVLKKKVNYFYIQKKYDKLIVEIFIEIYFFCK